MIRPITRTLDPMASVLLINLPDKSYDIGLHIVTKNIEWITFVYIVFQNTVTAAETGTTICSIFEIPLPKMYLFKLIF